MNKAQSVSLKTIIRLLKRLFYARKQSVILPQILQVLQRQQVNIMNDFMLINVLHMTENYFKNDKPTQNNTEDVENLKVLTKLLNKFYNQISSLEKSFEPRLSEFY